MTKAVRIHVNGGPEVLRYEDIALPPPGAGETRVRQSAIGVNFSDINVRRGGFYIARPQQFPLIPGNEAAGVVESVGAGVTDVEPGDRVAYAGMRGEFFEDTGAYAEMRNVPAERLVKLPAAITERQAAAMMVKGLAASMIINRVYKPAPGDTILIHGAAGGVGLILCQWAKHLGATVIGTVGSREKAEIARKHGCDHAVLYRESDFVAAVKAIAPHGVAAVYDGVGKDVFAACQEGLALGLAPGAEPPHCRRRRHARSRRRAVRSGGAARAHNRDRCKLSACGRGHCPSRCRSAQRRGLGAADSVKFPALHAALEPLRCV